ncbi:hypothetical protein EVAR_42807_1 [Eumeta japonica]|uniref:Uncharacterized protein n=1 Tax=Eumeta variegata TaxID=151549 RepID=A0A4C1WFB5_EUMVA|nr:hypothetical protein EVAR_42807_1 [Eumeta japonica]
MPNHYLYIIFTINEPTVRRGLALTRAFVVVRLSYAYLPFTYRLERCRCSRDTNIAGDFAVVDNFAVLYTTSNQAYNKRIMTNTHLCSYASVDGGSN